MSVCRLQVCAHKDRCDASTYFQIAKMIQWVHEPAENERSGREGTKAFDCVNRNKVPWHSQFLSSLLGVAYFE